ncbi:hypothetical protein DXG01_006707 [Tephrocybe rancida]|nr:hypothetical protein DXG01_006707 [Tephrocybe rancida]
MAPVTAAAPIAGAGAKVRTAMMSAAGNPGHGPSASKAKAKVGQEKVAGEKVKPAAKLPGNKAKAAVEKEQAHPAKKTTVPGGKKDRKATGDGWYIKGLHDFRCDYCDKQGKDCQKRVGKDNKVGACVGCFIAKIACTHSMKGKGKKVDGGVSDRPKKPKAKRKAPKSPEYVSDGDGDESNTSPHTHTKPAQVIIPADPIRVVTEEDVATARRHAKRPAPRPVLPPSPVMVPKAGKVITVQSRSPTPGPSNDPLLTAAIKARVELPSFSPRPEPHLAARQADWFDEMVQYVDEVNAGNAEHQQQITSTVRHLSAIVDALPSGAAAVDEVLALTSRVSDLEDSTAVGFKRLKERILKHRTRCDEMSAWVTELEERIQRLERSEREQRSHALRPLTPTPGLAHIGRTFVSPSPSTMSEESVDDEEREEGEVSEDEDEGEGEEALSERDTGMGEISEDPPSPFSPDDPKEKERSGEVAANVEVDKHLEGIASMSAASLGIALAMAPAAEASTETTPTSPHTLGADPVPSASSLPIASDTIAGQASSSEGARAVEVFLGGGPILPGIAVGTSVPLTTGDAILVPTISVINPTPENSQEQVPVAGPSTCRSSPRNHTGSEGSPPIGCELRSRTPLPPATGQKRKADDLDAGARTSKLSSKRQHK